MRTTRAHRVAQAVMYHTWADMTFVHWRYPAAVIQELLPPGLTAEEFDGSAWVGLTPFLMKDVRPRALPPLPGMSRFPETNVRTYARDGRGRGGLWFLSLDAGLLPAVLAARAVYALPYHWAGMSVRVAGERAVYRSRRRWPGREGARCHAEVELGPPMDEADGLARFLTERYRLFTVVAGRLATAEVDHPPWPLRHARLTRLDQDLLQAGGLPAPEGEPFVLASPGVRALIGMWSLV
ncbi:hypothetical protein Skr01_73250 [Sphaerisporangium krabiense]|uniref:DUF2071 domain-containing protein n=1 Tax=Sphaerisporangium krabiense TaxID=763782 RepID=A0A7W8Z902_9ACTN|nr:DUF2071 domain-containing protein [Sphaerisporangium krabiense]MBB5629582.1 hypothetical protein [Sphaerisporangium krabiense]GII67240.1 hypothetical protein Skr01_73250 [Sphaerisporangium krabiense]